MTTLLVVDDLATDRRIAGGLLEKNPEWKVIYAMDGIEALTQLELHLPDLVLTDMQMPNMNGLELVAAVKKEYPLIPVILMTAQGSEEIAVAALQRGAASYVAKRKLADDLVETVERVLAANNEYTSNTRLLHCVTNSQHEFVLENDLSLIFSAVNFLREGVTRMGICDENERLRLSIALEEALLNAYYHGNLEVSSTLREADHKSYFQLARERSQQQPYCDRHIYIEAHVSRTQAVYVIRDEGPGFDVSQIPDPTDPANIDRPCGRGLLLMRTFLDSVEFNAMGNQVTLVKRRTPETA